MIADDPVFVEGHHDALIVESLMEARGVSAAAAGSCIIDCGGVAEVTHYLELCQALGKKAHFVYDLDSLFRGRLRSCIGDDNSIRSLLAFAGVGGRFATYVGELDRLLTDLIEHSEKAVLNFPNLLHCRQTGSQRRLLFIE